MFHVKPVLSVTRYLGITLDDHQIDRFALYRDWLVTEGRRAGAIGPSETPRVESRHLADSLLFASQMGLSSRTVLDLGTGIGLPGVPLAIARPNDRFVLVDRSGRRVDLLRRILRILELENCVVVQDRIEDLDRSADVVLARACMTPRALSPLLPPLLNRGGLAIVGGSWRKAPMEEGWETIEIPRDVLDHPIWLLMMRPA